MQGECCLNVSFQLSLWGSSSLTFSFLSIAQGSPSVYRQTREHRNEKELRKSKPHCIIIHMPDKLSQLRHERRGACACCLGLAQAPEAACRLVCSGPWSDTALYSVLTKHPWLIISHKSHDNVRNCLTNHTSQKRLRGVK